MNSSTKALIGLLLAGVAGIVIFLFVNLSGGKDDGISIGPATAAACKRCHNTTTLAVNHFTTLSTTAMEGPASATIGGTGTNVTSYSAGSCTPQGGIGCHGTRGW